MIVETAPAVALETLSQGDTFEVVSPESVTTVYVVVANPEVATPPPNKVFVIRLHDGALFAWGKDATVIKRSYKVSPE